MKKQCRMSAKEYQALYAPNKVTTNKYHAKKVQGYDSKKEYDRAQVLHALQKLGLIKNLREQVPFTLIPSQKDESGKVIERPVTYKADFVYKDKNGNLVVEDTKGFKTPQYIIKRKLMLHVFGIKIKEL